MCIRDRAPFERVVRWRFDGIEMLLGSDTVVYSREGAAGAERVGVHVRDVGQRVTEVAALDMWLENTISGADDAAICYHKDGHVMGYQLVRTEDLPSFARTPAKRLAPDGDGATAVATLERAKSILRFVQRHCTDDAATYCLTRKGGDDGEAIELWRVDDNKGRKSSGPARATPFARACALLCLRIARRVERGDRARCRRLLDRCVALADARSDAAVVAEAHLLVALSYGTFWIQRGAIPARAAFCFISYLSVINLTKGSLASLPKLSDADAWMLGVLSKSQYFCAYTVLGVVVANYLLHVETRVNAALKDAREKEDASLGEKISDMRSFVRGKAGRFAGMLVGKDGKMRFADRHVDVFSRWCFPAAYVVAGASPPRRAAASLDRSSSPMSAAAGASAASFAAARCVSAMPSR